LSIENIESLKIPKFDVGIRGRANSIFLLHIRTNLGMMLTRGYKHSNV